MPVSLACGLRPIFARGLLLTHLYWHCDQGNVPAIPRLGIPALTLNDGPQGFRGEAGTSTCWPSGLTMAATWNVTTMNRWGTAMGEEFVAKGEQSSVAVWTVPNP